MQSRLPLELLQLKTCRKLRRALKSFEDKEKILCNNLLKWNTIFSFFSFVLMSKKLVAMKPTLIGSASELFLRWLLIVRKILVRNSIIINILWPVGWSVGWSVGQLVGLLVVIQNIEGFFFLTIYSINRAIHNSIHNILYGIKQHHLQIRRHLIGSKHL